MERVAVYKNIRSDDLEIFRTIDPDGLEYEARQLSSGPLGLNFDLLELPSLTLCCYHYRAAIHFLDKRPDNWLVFMGWFHADGPPNYKGSIMELNDAIVCTGNIINEYTMHPNMYSFDISVKPEITAQLGWNYEYGPPHIRTPGRSMQRLGIIVRRALKFAQSWENVEPSPLTIMALQKQILTGLQTAMQPWLQRSTPAAPRSHLVKRNYHLVKNAEAWLTKLDSGEVWTVATMAAGISVSERTLYRAFQTWANVGPNRYFALQKIYDFRKRLLSGDVTRGAVTRAAIASGFDHFGRLSMDYKKLFGETPNKTLQRFSKKH